MRLSVLIQLILFSTAWAQHAVYPSAGNIFDGRLHRIDIFLHPDSLKSLIHEQNRWTNQVYACTFVFDELDTFLSAGVRLRGNTSRNAERPSFKILFDYGYNKDFRGLEELNVLGVHNDPSLVRTLLSYQLFSHAIPWSLRTAHVEFYINGTYRGLHTLVEDADRTFLKSRFGSASGAFFKCTWPADLKWKGSDPQV